MLTFNKGNLAASNGAGQITLFNSVLRNAFGFYQWANACDFSHCHLGWSIPPRRKR